MQGSMNHIEILQVAYKVLESNTSTCRRKPDGGAVGMDAKLGEGKTRQWIRDDRVQAPCTL